MRHYKVSGGDDVVNRLVIKNLDSGTDILYLYDGWQVVEERHLVGTKARGALLPARRQAGEIHADPTDSTTAASIGIGVSICSRLLPPSVREFDVTELAAR